MLLTDLSALDNRKESNHRITFFGGLSWKGRRSNADLASTFWRGGGPKADTITRASNS
jgi:hypothetical protein